MLKLLFYIVLFVFTVGIVRTVLSLLTGPSVEKPEKRKKRGSRPDGVIELGKDDYDVQ